MKILKVFLPLIIVLFLSYFTIRPFFVSGFFPIHDDTQVQRVFEMHKSLSDGMFPVRWVSDLGYNYGYPIFNFYAPFAYYVGSLFMFLGFDALVATKIMMSLGIILSGIFMYLFAKEFWGKWGGIVSAILYLYAPYHALNIYVRGDVAEFWAYTFIPLAFYGVWKTYKDKKWKFLLVGSIGYAGVILSHNLTAMMISPFLFLFTIILFLHNKDKNYYLLLTIFSGILLSAFYWLPVFSEMKYTNVLSQVGGGADYKDHFVCLPQLWDSPWGFGGSTASCIDGLSFKIGKLHILLFLFSFTALFFLGKKEKLKFWISLFAVSSILLSIFLTQNYSKFIWDSIGTMAFFQYPWRFLLIISFFISFLGGAVGWILLRSKLHSLLNKFAVAFAIFAIIFFNQEIFNPQTISGKTANDYTNNLSLHFRTSKISDEYMPKGFYKPKSSNEIPEAKMSSNKNLQVVSLNEKTNLINAKVIANGDQDTVINLAYFPAWQVFIDNNKVEPRIFNKGFIVNIPSGEHIVDIKFIQTPIEKFANIISLTTVFLLLTAFFFTRKNQTQKTKQA